MLSWTTDWKWQLVAVEGAVAPAKSVSQLFV